jgi:solute carrier family 35 protein C2
MKLYRDTPNRYERHTHKSRAKWFEKIFRKNSDDFRAIVISLSSILVYYCFSIILTFFNRHLFITYKFPLSITVIHLIIKFMISTLVRSISTACNSKQRITLDWMTYLKRIIPTGIASAADIGFSNWSLQYITITLYTMSKSTVILFIFLFSILFKLEKWVRKMKYLNF